MTLLAWEISTIVRWLALSLVLSFLGTGMRTDLFQSCGHCWVFQICWHNECKTLLAKPIHPLGIWIVLLELFWKQNVYTYLKGIIFLFLPYSVVYLFIKLMTVRVRFSLLIKFLRGNLKPNIQEIWLYPCGERRWDCRKVARILKLLWNMYFIQRKGNIWQNVNI